MCGELKFENVSAKLGNIMTIETKHGELLAKFNSHARSESLEAVFLSKGWKEGKLHASSYVEGHGATQREFLVPEGKAIKIIYRDDIHNTPYNIVTQAANTPEEIACHPRHPVLVDK